MLLEFETGETGEAEVVSKTLARTPPSTHAGGQDDGSTQTPSNDLLPLPLLKVLEAALGHGSAQCAVHLPALQKAF